MSENQSSSDFLTFSQLCRNIESTRSKLAKIEYVSKYFVTLSEDDLRIASTFLSGKIFAPGIESREINVGYSQIWRIVSSYHGLGETELSQYYLKYGDLGSAIEDWLRTGEKRNLEKTGRLFSDSSLSLADFYTALNDLARASGKGSNERR